MWYTGFDPYTLKPVFSAKSQHDKLAQRQYFFWYKPEEQRNIEQSLRRIGRADLISELCPHSLRHQEAHRQGDRQNGRQDYKKGRRRK